MNWIEKIVITAEFYFTKIRDSVAIAAAVKDRVRIDKLLNWMGLLFLGF